MAFCRQPAKQSLGEEDAELKILKMVTVSECGRYIGTTCSLALNWDLLKNIVKELGTKGLEKFSACFSRAVLWLRPGSTATIAIQAF